MARAAGLGEGYSGHSGRVGPGNQDDSSGSSAAGGADSRALEVAVNARAVHQEREGARGAGVVGLMAVAPFAFPTWIPSRLAGSNRRYADGRILLQLALNRLHAF